MHIEINVSGRLHCWGTVGLRRQVTHAATSVRTTQMTWCNVCSRAEVAILVLAIGYIERSWENRKTIKALSRIFVAWSFHFFLLCVLRCFYQYFHSWREMFWMIRIKCSFRLRAHTAWMNGWMGEPVAKRTCTEVYIYIYIYNMHIPYRDKTDWRQLHAENELLQFYSIILFFLCRSIYFSFSICPQSIW